tara:strand:+ start:14830 stop:15462 length:633 start_codon:yes stop_codon:yes gene_type:complete
MAKAFIKLLENNGEITKKILNALTKEVNRSMKKVSSRKMLAPLQKIIGDSLSKSPELASLSGGQLRYDFGIPAGVDVVTPIISAVVGAIFVQASPVNLVGGQFKGSVQFHMQPTDLSNLLSLPQGKIITEKGASLPWLQWLLTLGDQIIIADFGVVYGTGLGRSGGGQMSSVARPFKVNSTFSGTADNNFVTKAIYRKRKDIANLIKRSM